MRKKPDSTVESSGREEVRRRRVDLNFPQVAGSAVAAVVAAKLASYFGVYGTILGAGVVSVVATCGGSFFQHFFSRTGEQIRDAAVATKPREQALPAPGEFTGGTVYRARIRGWRRPVLAAAVVFLVTMAGITTYELVSGGSLSGGTGTTVSDVLHGSSSADSGGGSAPASPERSPSAPSAGTSSSASGTSTAGTGDASGGGGTAVDGATATPSPSASTDRGPGVRTEVTPSPSATPSGSVTAPAPSASSRSGTAGQDPAGHAVP
ncbi:hypothetical protein ACWD5R_37600 [Streptomyces sp. NPDC002514]|uniref:hypothetical protein n=1 Tax=Streptomyces sp. NPDC001270 TaxID=3364554 RepID=UPI0036B31934